MVCESNEILFLEIKEKNILNILKNYLYLENDKILEQVLMMIGNIVVESNYFRDLALRLGILERVVSISKDPKRNIEVIKNSMFLISNILRGKPHPELSKVNE